MYLTLAVVASETLEKASGFTHTVEFLVTVALTLATVALTIVTYKALKAEEKTANNSIDSMESVAKTAISHSDHVRRMRSIQRRGHHR